MLKKIAIIILMIFASNNLSASIADLNKKYEKTSLIGYVPYLSIKSGVTIASGLDLGNFDNILKLNISTKLKLRLVPFVGLRGNKARKVAHKLTISSSEADEIDNALGEYNLKYINPKVNNMSIRYKSNDSMSAFYSLFMNAPKAFSLIVKRIKRGNIDLAIKRNLMWTKSGGRFMAGLLKRRIEELYLLFPERKDFIRVNAKKEYNKYKRYTKLTWDEIINI
jgi:GH24 family phage-related lysozyme (muramidase)